MEENRTWDLSVLYRDFDDPKIEEDIASAEKCVSELKALADSADTASSKDIVCGYLKISEKFALLTERLCLPARSGSLQFKAQPRNA